MVTALTTTHLQRPPISIYFHTLKLPLNNHDHLSTTATNFGSRGWSLYRSWTHSLNAWVYFFVLGATQLVRDTCLTFFNPPLRSDIWWYCSTKGHIGKYGLRVLCDNHIIPKLTTALSVIKTDPHLNESNKELNSLHTTWFCTLVINMYLGARK
jgi:hypothetical protein